MINKAIRGRENYFLKSEIGFDYIYEKIDFQNKENQISTFVVMDHFKSSKGLIIINNNAYQIDLPQE